MKKVTQTILLVNGSLSERKTYCRHLHLDRQHTYNILEAETGEQALLLCRQQLPDMILLDYALPDMDGLEFLNSLKSQLGQINTPVIILAGKGKEKRQTAAGAIKSGATDLLVAKDTEYSHLAGKQTQEAPQQEPSELERRVKQRTAELKQANQKLQTMLEELQVVEEEFRSSNEELTRNQQEIEQERQRYQDLFEFAPDGYLVTDNWGNIREANRAAATLLGIKQKSLIGKPLLVFIAKQQRQTIRTLFLSQLQQVQHSEVNLVPRSGSPFPAMLAVTSMHDFQSQEVCLRWLLRDIRTSKQMEQRLQKMVDASQVGIVFVKSRLEILSINQALLRMLGYTLEEFRSGGLNWKTIISPEFVSTDPQAMVLPSHTSIIEPTEKILIGKDGRRIPVLVSTTDLPGEEDEMVAFILDISDRKQAQEKIREQAALLDVATDAIFVRDLSDRILYWNSGAERLYGWQAAEILGKNYSKFLYKRVPSQVSEAFKSVIKQGEWHGELNKITKSGQQLIVQSRWTLVRDEVGKPKSILTVDSDITEKKQFEAQFYRAQRLESLGILASGIAHDLNNILTPILTISQLLALRIPDLDEYNRQLLKMLESNSKRGADLVKQITSFARGAEGRRIPIQPKYLLKEIEQIVKSTFPKSIEIHTNIPTQDICPILAEPTQIHQVLMNLCVNACDAMPNGGTITISAENIFVDENYVAMNFDAKVGQYVAIAVSDTGCGIPQESLSRIFEPFFTTKETSKGTGLGLSSVVGIIKNHGGFVNVRSEVGFGSHFQVYLPASDVAVIQSAENEEMAGGNGELILVVDDEASIRDIIKTSLEENNYKTLIASDGIDALSVYAQHKNEISVVLMDIQMPSMDGFKAIRVLQQINPSVKIIAISGLASNRKLLETGGISVQAFLLKPYSIKEILNTIKNVLATP